MCRQYDYIMIYNISQNCRLGANPPKLHFHDPCLCGKPWAMKKNKLQDPFLCTLDMQFELNVSVKYPPYASFFLFPFFRKAQFVYIALSKMSEMTPRRHIRTLPDCLPHLLWNYVHAQEYSYFHKIMNFKKVVLINNVRW